MVLLRFGGLFVRPKTALWAWGAVVVAAILGYTVWSWNKIDDLKRDNIEQALRTKNEALEQNNEILKFDQEQMRTRMEELNASIERLNGRFAASVRQRQQDYDDMTGGPTVPGQKPDTAVLEDRANTGMNKLFDDLEALSEPQP